MDGSPLLRTSSNLASPEVVRGVQRLRGRLPNARSDVTALGRFLLYDDGWVVDGWAVGERPSASLRRVSSTSAHLRQCPAGVRHVGHW